jgi:manganese transport protein
MRKAPGTGTVRSWSDQVVERGQSVLDGKQTGFFAILPFVGPSVVASIAYMDPGNFATNIEAGASFGLKLLWVVVLANLMAMLFQSISARIGIVTDKSLAALCRDFFPRPVVYIMWAAGEIGAMATDLAEFLGGAIGLHLLLPIPLLACLMLMGIATYGMLLLQTRGFRPLEILITGFVSLIGLAYLAEVLLAPPDWAEFATSALVPRLAGPHSITLAVGIIGATVMPHVLYLHSSLTAARIPARHEQDRRILIRFSNREVIVALSIAGLINMAMLTMAAQAFHKVAADVADIATAYKTLTPLLGAGAASLFMVALLSSGFSSSVVGTMAGQVIMQDFVGFAIPLWLRRLVTMVPSVIVVALGLDETQALVNSQVVLSLVLPIPLVSLLIIARSTRLMGIFRLGRGTLAGAILAALIVLGLNVMLLADTFGIM